MGVILTREKWNNLLQAYNDIVEAIAEECEPPEPLDLVNLNHVWTKSDVKNLQDRLIELCECNLQLTTFLNLPESWQTKIIEDIEFALSIGACIQGDSEPQEFELGEFGNCVSKQCNGDPVTTECGGSGQPMPVDLTAFLSAHQQEPVSSNAITRTWRITERRGPGPICSPFESDGTIEEHVIFNGPIKCDGTLEPESGMTDFYRGEFYLGCFPNCDAFCESQYAAFKACAFSRPPRKLKLIILCNDCQTCEELGYAV
jgi:hypothetical protein